MKITTLLLMLFVTMVVIAGCGQRKDVATKEFDRDYSGQQKERAESQEHSKHGGHNHAFTDPAERALKWNDPERDQWQHPEEIVAALNLTRGATVADLGAGTGYMIAFLSKAVGESGTVLALDASPEMIAYLTKRTPELGPAKIIPQQVGFDDPELQPDSFDAILTLDTWHHIQSREAYAKKVYEGLKIGGRFVVVDFTVDAETGPPKSTRLAPEQVQKQLESAGFQVEIVPDSMPRHYMVVGKKV